MGRLALISTLILGLTYPARAQDGIAALRARAFDLAYNLDHDEAVALLRKGLERSPDDPSLHRALASILWLNLLFRRGALTVDHYLGSFSRTQIEMKKPPPDVDAEFRYHVAKAIELAERRVATNPGDPQAHYDLGAAVALRSSYIATVEGKMLSGFKAARTAFDEHEKVVSLDSSRKDAGVMTGTYRYIVSTLSLPMRVMAYVVGFGGGRERGIRLLQEAAAHDSESRAEAMFALILIYNREEQYDDALKVLEDLGRRYPRNRLIVLEKGATALRAGRYAQANTILTEGLERLARERRARMPGEESLWRYKRGAARAGLGQTALAIADLQAATAADAPGWVAGRAHAELARLSLARGDRAAAAAQASQAESLCERGNDPACVEQAKKLLRNSHGQ
jgi:uncharacterized protein DUF3808